MSHIDESKKELFRNVHRLSRLSVRLEYSPNGGFMMHHNSKPMLVVEVKFKAHLNKSSMELKESVLGNLNKPFSLGGMVF